MPNVVDSFHSCVVLWFVYVGYTCSPFVRASIAFLYLPTYLSICRWLFLDVPCMPCLVSSCLLACYLLLSQVPLVILRLFVRYPPSWSHHCFSCPGVHRCRHLVSARWMGKASWIRRASKMGKVDEAS
ncbi:hypothetical protein IWX49DRAFT_241177 [Phyllosticta citricarpa]|uniref:Uncharacterized protein n=1 Tax=Phyllosticta paracitricarpa TaxID=2016321 RepID=A0ABR1N3I3_9PEZI